MDGIRRLRAKATWSKAEFVDLYFELLPEFSHKETGKYLNQKI